MKNNYALGKGRGRQRRGEEDEEMTRREEAIFSLKLIKKHVSLLFLKGKEDEEQMICSLPVGERSCPIRRISFSDCDTY